MADIAKFASVAVANLSKIAGVSLGALGKLGPLNVALGLEAGTKMWFYANTAPTGWTVDGTPADCLLAVKGGSQAYNENGGTLQGTWTQPNHTLTTDEIPAHDHGSAGSHTHSATRQDGLLCTSSYPKATGPGSGYKPRSRTSKTTDDSGSSGSHTHASYGGDGAHNHGTTFRPYSCVGIICTKDASGQDVPSSVKVWLYANAAPSGWTIDSTPADRLVAVKGGTQAFNATGGTEAGTWTQPSHTLTESEIPSHTHGAKGAHTHTIQRAQYDASGWAGSGTVDSENSGSGRSTDSDGAHTHTSVGGGSAHSHGSAYRPLARVGIICSKDAAGSFDPGLTAYFYQNTAPANWSAESFADTLLAVKGGSVYTTGAAESGTWTQPDHTLTTSEIPAHTHGEAGAHTHTMAYSNANFSWGTDYNGVKTDWTPTVSTAGSHTHDSVGGGGAHNHGNTYRPYAAVGLIATKD